MKGDTAFSEAYCVAYLTLEPKGERVDVGAGVTTATSRPRSSTTVPHGRRGERSTDDPLYAFLAGAPLPEATAS